MKVLILGAGQGKRLLPLTEDIPKSLLDIGGKRLIERQIEAFRGAGISEFVVLTGYRADKMDEVLEEYMAAHKDVHIRTVYNPFFAVADNLASCWMARHEMDGDFIQVNGDNLFKSELVQSLLASKKAPVTATIDTKEIYDNDDMKVILDGERLTEIGKKLPLEAVSAESIGIYLFRGEGGNLYRQKLEEAMQDPSGLRQWFPYAIGNLAKETDVCVCNIHGHQWCEIDFPKDLQQARGFVADW